MFSTTDTIAAIATPAGRGAIGVVRLSGPDAQLIAGILAHAETPLRPRHATLSRICSANEVVDHAIVTLFPGPHSYTGDDLVEISAHGNPVILQAIVAAAVTAGARLAEPGEFTLRAFLNQRIDLPQAEAIADLIDAVTPLQARAAFDQLDGTLTLRIAAIDAALFDLIARLEASIDFPDEGYHFVQPGELIGALDRLLDTIASLLADGRRGRLIREGLQVAITGKPNVGKSSLFNALVGSARAIVTQLAGTTRDLVSEIVDVDGLRVTLVDSAGIRATEDAVESVGVELARRAMQVADVVLVVVDGSEPLDEMDVAVLQEARHFRHLVVANKSDVRNQCDHGFLAVSATKATGLGELRRELARALGVEPRRERPLMTNLRHLTLMERAREMLARARESLIERGGSLSEEFLLADLQGARNVMEQISGKRAPEDLLAHIFSHFCVGK